MDIEENMFSHPSESYSGIPADDAPAAADDIVPKEMPAAVDETPAPVNETPNTELLESFRKRKITQVKQQLTLLGAVTNRGQFASQAQKSEALKAVTALEGLGAVSRHEETMQQQEGRWTLVLSDVEPFRVSPFFMALEEALLDYPKRDEVTMRYIECCVFAN
eukprot:2736052-Pyramimonas_sp.AAC.1